MYSRSDYETRGNHMSIDKDNEFKYPVVYGMPLKGVKFVYSTRDNGMFGVPKLIIANGSSYSLLDLDGEYGMTQYSFAVVDTPENLIQIQKVIESPWFRTLKSNFCGLGDSINKNAIIDAQGKMRKFMSEFRKDFWKEFI